MKSLQTALRATNVNKLAYSSMRIVCKKNRPLLALPLTPVMLALGMSGLGIGIALVA